MYKKARVTRQDVANRAGVSTATVSYVLNDLGDANNISPETQHRVKAAVAELKYIRNISARRLATGKTKVIAITTDNKSVNYPINTILHQIQQGVSDVCFKRGYNSIVYGVYNNDWTALKDDLALSYRVDGMIVINPPTNHTIIQELYDDKFPIVSLSSVRFPYMYSVSIDNFAAAQVATNHLIAKGHQNILHIAYSEPDLTDVFERIAGYKHAMTEANLESKCLVRYTEYSFESAFAIMNEHLASDTLPTAIFAGNDITAIGCMAAIWKNGLTIPGDVAIVGFDDIPVSAYLTPPLTTIKLDGQQQGMIAANTLLDLIEGVTPAHNQVLLHSPLIIRESS
jgi:DNA-binding LacI/PurR family transcriptional regulator